MNAKHTPGPWNISGGWIHAGIYPDSGNTILTVKGLHLKNREANARLIAAAPELLEALTEISLYNAGYPKSKYTENPYEHKINEMCDIADKAIAKAEGKQ